MKKILLILAVGITTLTSCEKEQSEQIDCNYGVIIGYETPPPNDPSDVFWLVIEPNCVKGRKDYITLTRPEYDEEIHAIGKTILLPY